MFERYFGGKVRPKDIYYEDREIMLREGIALDEFLEGINSMEGKVILKAFTATNKYSSLIGSSLSKPDWLISDGSITVLEDGDNPEFDEFVADNSSYIGWSGENASFTNLSRNHQEHLASSGIKVEDMRSQFFMQTSLKAEGLRKKLKELNLKNIDLRCEAHSSKVGRPRKISA